MKASAMGRAWLAGLLCLGACVAAAQSTASVNPATDPAKAALDRGDYRTAETLYRKALILAPRSPQILTNLGIALQMQGRSTAAISLFEQALQQKHLPRTYALLAEERCKSRDLDGARPMLIQILKEDAADPITLALVAPCYLDLDEPLEAVQVYKNLLTSPAFPHDLALIQLSKAYLLAGQFFYGQLVKAPGSDVYLQAIRTARDQGSPGARGAFDEAARSSPYFRADLSFDDAVLRWRDHPADPALLYLLSVLSSEQSMQQLQACSEQFPDSPYFAQIKLEMLVQQGRQDEAEQGYENLLKTHPELPDLQYSLGMIYRKQRMWEKAAAVFRAQLARDPDDERSAARLSEALEQLGQWTQLRDLLGPRVNQADPPLWASLDMAEAAEKLDDPQTAIRVLASAERTHMSNQAIHFRLIRLYRRVGNTAEAQAESRWTQSSFAKAPH